MASFRLLHISDFHFSIWPDQQHWKKLFSQSPWTTGQQIYSQKMRDFPPGYSAQVANIAAKVIFEMRDQFDLIAISGDLATTGHTECLTTARQFTHSPAHTKWLNSEAKPTLQAANKGMILVPGNHDRYADHKGAPGGRNFDSVYEDEWPKPRRYVQHRIIEKDNERVACIGVDFCLGLKKTQVVRTVRTAGAGARRTKMQSGI